MFDGAEGSGSTYEVNTFQVPDLVRGTGDTSDTSRQYSSDAVPILFWPLYHPNFGHFVADFLPLLVKEASLLRTLSSHNRTSLRFVLPFDDAQIQQLGLAKHLQLLQAFSDGVPVASLARLSGQCFAKMASCRYSTAYTAHTMPIH
jgi:hypothetical protein